MDFFLGRSMSSDQNYVGLLNGNVVRARAIVRLVPEARWISANVLALKTTPMTEHSRLLDNIEHVHDPHAHAAEDVEPADIPAMPPRRRVRITYSDLQKYGFTDGCSRCSCYRDGAHRRARFHKHSETCRARI